MAYGDFILVDGEVMIDKDCCYCSLPENECGCCDHVSSPEYHDTAWDNAPTSDELK
jgi:hypothetical protein